MTPHEIRRVAQPDYARQHGCAFFVWPDKEKVHRPEKTGGVYSLGGEPALAFHRPSDLPPDVVWWTNLTDPECLRLGRFEAFKSASFLGEDWLTRISEWGTPHTEEDLRFFCAAWAEVLGRLGQWLSRWAQDEAARQGPDRVHPVWAWGEGTLAETLAWRMGWVDETEEVHEALRQAWFGVVRARRLENDPRIATRQVAVALPRMAHARAITKTRYPVGPFKEVPPSRWPTPDKRWGWLAEQTRPTLVRFDKVAWQAGAERTAEVWWGRRGRRFSAADMDPVWITAEEALSAKSWIDAIPEIALQAEHWTTLDLPDGWPLELPPESTKPGPALTENSMVSALLVDNLWRAGACRLHARRSGPVDHLVSSRAVWWRAADRMRTWPAAKAFLDQGFEVLEWGEGRVVVRFQPDKVLLHDWAKAVQASGVRPPTALAREVALRDPDHTQIPLPPEDVDIWLKEHCGVEARLWLDRLLWPWPHPKPRMVSNLMKEAAKSLSSVKAPSEAWRKEWYAQLAAAGRAAMATMESLRKSKDG